MSRPARYSQQGAAISQHRKTQTTLLKEIQNDEDCDRSRCCRWLASASFAQGVTAPATSPAPAAKVVAPAAASAEKKVEAPKAAEPVKAEVAKPEVKAAEAKGDKHEAPKKHEKHAKKVEKTEKAEVKTEAKAEKPLAAAPTSK